jgi:hypothetical protein
MPSAVVAAMVRVKYLANFYYSIDINWDDFPLAILTMLELSLSVMCVCFPAIKLLLNAYFSKWFGGSDATNITRSLQLSSNSGESRPKGRFERTKLGLLSFIWKSNSQTTPPLSSKADTGRRAFGNTKADMQARDMEMDMPILDPDIYTKN